MPRLVFFDGCTQTLSSPRREHVYWRNYGLPKSTFLLEPKASTTKHNMSESRQFISVSEAQSPFFVGVDLGGQSIKIGVVDDFGRPLSWLSVPTEIDQGGEAACQRMAEGIDRAIAEAGVDKSEVAYVGLGSPGTMDIPAGMLLLPVNLKGWENFAIRDRLSFHCGKPVAFTNDGAAAAYGEFWAGAGQEMNSLVLLTLGTGIGCGIIVNDFSIDGRKQPWCGVWPHDCESGS